MGAPWFEIYRIRDLSLPVTVQLRKFSLFSITVYFCPSKTVAHEKSRCFSIAEYSCLAKLADVRTHNIDTNFNFKCILIAQMWITWHRQYVTSQRLFQTAVDNVCMCVYTCVCRCVWLCVFVCASVCVDCAGDYNACRIKPSDSLLILLCIAD